MFLNVSEHQSSKRPFTTYSLDVRMFLYTEATFCSGFLRRRLMIMSAANTPAILRMYRVLSVIVPSLAKLLFYHESALGAVRFAFPFPEVGAAAFRATLFLTSRFGVFFHGPLLYDAAHMLVLMHVYHILHEALDLALVGDYDDLLHLELVEHKPQLVQLL